MWSATANAAAKTPQLPTASDNQVRAIVRFRSEISRLDARCDAAAEEMAAKRMRTEYSRRSNRYSMAVEQSPNAASCEQEVHRNSIASIFRDHFYGCAAH